MEFKNYQKKMANFLAKHKNAILSVDMGLGKTASTLAFLDWLDKKSMYELKVLIVAPKRVAENNWQSEMIKFGYMDLASKSIIVKGYPPIRKKALDNFDKPIKIISRDNLGDIDPSVLYDVLIIDELTSFKTIGSQRTKLMLNISATRKIGLTGTFLANGAVDIYAQCAVCDIYFNERNFYAWRAVNFKDVLAKSGLQFSKWQLNKPLDELIKPIKDNIFTLTAKDWLEIPEVTEHTHKITLDPTTYKQIAELDAFLSTKIGDDVVVIKDNAKFAKLQTLCNGFIYMDDAVISGAHHNKLQAVVDTIERYVTYNESVLVFYAYVEERHWIEQQLTKLGIKFMGVEKKKFMSAWNNKEIQVLLAHPASAGHGLNLQYGGRVIVWSTLTYNYEFYAQGNARLARTGQQHNVQIHYFIAEKTCEEKVLKALSDKDKAQKQFLDLTKYGEKRV